MAIPLPDLVDEVEARLQQMGFEVVEAGWVGSRRRPIFRIRMDLPDAVPGKGGVSVDQCAEVSRALEPWFDAHPDIPDRYVLEVSSPGVERPMTRPGDWNRFKGNPVVVKGSDLPGGKGNRLEGEILGLREDGEGGVRISLGLESGEEIQIPLEKIEKAHLTYRWD